MSKEAILEQLLEFINRNKENWNEIKGDLISSLEEAKEGILNLIERNDLKLEDVLEIVKRINSLKEDKPWRGLFWHGIIFEMKGDPSVYKRIFMDEDKEIINNFVKSLMDHDIKSVQDYFNKYKEIWNNVWEVRQFRVVITNIGTIFRPDLFFPVWEKTFIENLVKFSKNEISRDKQKFKEAVERYLTFLYEFIEINKSRIQLDEKYKMLELGYHIYKFLLKSSNGQEKNTEIKTNTNILAYLGKIDWSINGYNGFDDKTYKKFAGKEWIPESKFIRKYHWGIEWWYFYKDFANDYYYAVCFGKHKFTEKEKHIDVIFWISKNPENNMFYIVGVYGDVEVLNEDEFENGSSIYTEIKKEVLDKRKVIPNEGVLRQYYGKKWVFLRASKALSTVLYRPYHLGKDFKDIQDRLKIKKKGKRSFLYILSDESIAVNILDNLIEYTKQNIVNDENDNIYWEPNVDKKSVIEILRRLKTKLTSNPENIDNEDKGMIRDLLEILKEHQQVIFYGPPGTGKTYYARMIGKHGGFNETEFVTFHQSYGYEEFIEGIWPETNNENKHGGINYELRDGIFKKLAIKATYNLLRNLWAMDSAKGESTKNECGLNDISCMKEYIRGKFSELKDNEELRKRLHNIFIENIDNIPRYLIIIDEINRGDISRIFGELITLIEDDKRLLMENQMIETLPYSRELFAVPPNLYFIGTMNSADRSIALVDYALRRRFAFVEFTPNYDKVDREIVLGDRRINLKDLLKRLNERIERVLNGDRDHLIGHSYFMKISGNDDDKVVDGLKTTWYYRIIPLLREYFYDRPEDFKRVLIREDYGGDREEAFRKLTVEPSIRDEEFIDLLCNAVIGKC